MSKTNAIPDKQQCMKCHNNEAAGNDCVICHGSKYSLIDIHPLSWKNNHGLMANLDKKWCQNCHFDESFCTDCHRGDIKEGSIHDIIYKYTHAEPP